MRTRTWFVTGCSTGFGRVLAELLLARGARVVATARKPETLRALVEAHGERALAVKLDITSADDIASAVAAARQRFGEIDVLVNNAGFGVFGTVENSPLEGARDVFETNFFGTIAVIKAILPRMIERRDGHIVNIGSVAGQIGFPGLGYYSAVKFALTGLTESLAAELSLLGVKVTLAELGPFATDFTRSLSVVPPPAHYDMAALSQAAGNSHWGAGEDPAEGAAALLAALEDPSPPKRMVLGRLGREVVARHDAARRDERARWWDTADPERVTA